MTCLLCNIKLDEYETCNVRWKGLKTMIQCSIDRNDNLVNILQGLETLTVHTICRKKYTHRKYNGKLYKFLPPNHSSDYSQPNFEYIPIPILNENVSNSNAKRPSAAENTTQKSPVKYINTTLNTNNLEIRTNFEAGSSNQLITNHPMKPDSTSETTVHLTVTPLEADIETEMKYNVCLEESPLEPNRQISVNNADNEACHEQEINYELQPLSDDNDPTKPFPFEHKCLICAKLIDDTQKPLKGNKVSNVLKDCTQQTILRKLKTRPTSRNLKVLQRIQGVDLVQVKARYHRICFSRLLYNYCYEGEEKIGRGRPMCPLIMSAADKIYRYIDGSDRTEFTASELTSSELHGDYEPTWRTIEKKLKIKYAGKIFFTPMPGHNTVVTVIKDSDNTERDEQTGANENNETGTESMETDQQTDAIVRNMLPLAKTLDKDEDGCNEFDVFGKYIAMQLKSMHEEDAILAQQEIQSTLTKYKLKKIQRTHYNITYTSTPQASSSQLPDNQSLVSPTLGHKRASSNNYSPSQPQLPTPQQMHMPYQSSLPHQTFTYNLL